LFGAYDLPKFNNYKKTDKTEKKREIVKILAKVIIYMYKYQKYIHINSLKCTIKNKINVIHIEMIGFWWTLK
jgi:hypothetical protein